MGPDYYAPPYKGVCGELGFVVVCFLYKINPKRRKIVCCVGKSGPKYGFQPIFSWVGLALGWGVRRFRNTPGYLHVFPTQQKLLYRENPTVVIFFQRHLLHSNTCKHAYTSCVAAFSANNRTNVDHGAALMTVSTWCVPIQFSTCTKCSTNHKPQTTINTSAHMMIVMCDVAAWALTVQRQPTIRYVVDRAFDFS